MAARQPLSKLPRRKLFCTLSFGTPRSLSKMVQVKSRERERENSTGAQTKSLKKFNTNRTQDCSELSPARGSEPAEYRRCSAVNPAARLPYICKQHSSRIKHIIHYARMLGGRPAPNCTKRPTCTNSTSCHGAVHAGSRMQ